MAKAKTRYATGEVPMVGDTISFDPGSSASFPRPYVVKVTEVYRGRVQFGYMGGVALVPECSLIKRADG